MKGGKVWKGIKWKRKKKMKGKVGNDYQRNEWKEKKKGKTGKDGKERKQMKRKKERRERNGWE